MSEKVLSFGRVFAIQLRLVLGRGWRGRAIGFGLVLVQLVAMVLFGVILSISIDREGVSFTQAVDFAESFPVPLTRATAALLVCLLAQLIIAWFGPFKLWDGEPPSRREYHWAMPVAKGRHDLARVLAGVVVLLGWGAALYGSVLVLALVGGQAGGLAGVAPLAWASLFLGPLLWYLVTSFFTVRMEHPSGWIWSIVGVTAAMTTLSQLLPLGPVVRILGHLLFERFGIVTAVAGPVGASLLGIEGVRMETWPLAWLVWVAALSALVVWGAHDRRRLP